MPMKIGIIGWGYVGASTGIGLSEINDEVADFELSEKFEERSYAPFIEPYPSGYVRYVTITQISQKTTNPGDSANSRWGNLKLIRVRVSWRPEYLKKKSERNLVFQTMVTDDREPW